MAESEAVNEAASAQAAKNITENANRRERVPSISQLESETLPQPFLSDLSKPSEVCSHQPAETSPLEVAEHAVS